MATWAKKKLRLTLRTWHIIHSFIFIMIYLYSEEIMKYIDVKQLILIFGTLHMLTISVARNEIKQLKDISKVENDV